jgi:transposase
MSKPRRHSEEFKREAVKLVTEGGYTTAQAARSLGINENLLRKWRHKYSTEEKAMPTKDLTETEAQELARLREENRRLRMERDILKKATAFFANERN